MTTVVTRGAASAQALGYASSSAAVTYVEDVFSTYLYTGNSSTQTITNGIDLSGKGGLVWVKGRNSTGYHRLYDTIRGTSSQLYSNATNAAGTQAELSSFNNNGFSLTSLDGNISPYNYASWTFREQPKFFDVVTYTGNGVAGRTISHNLGSLPGCIIVKAISVAGQDWFVYHRSLSTNGYLLLNSTGAESVYPYVYNPTTTTFDVASSVATNGSGTTYVAYLFAHNAGGFGLTGTDNVISCGSLTMGAGITTATLGYEPQWLLIKGSNNANEWWLIDNMRGLSQANYARLFANSSAAESVSSGPYILPTATGFTMDGSIFGSGNSFIYIAIRRGPMKVPTSGTSVFTPIARTGTGATATVTGVGFPPDLGFSKSRNGLGGRGASFMDRLRGAQRDLDSSSTSSEATATDTLSSFNMDGVTLGADTYTAQWNYSSNANIEYFLRRAPGFFDEVCYTGTGVTRTVTHNLAAVPELMIVKSRSLGSTLWYVYAEPLGATKSLLLNTTNASFNYLPSWNNTSPTASVFTLGTGSSLNNPGSTYVAYLFATVAGVSKVGTYTGNGTTQTINCGFGAGGVRFVLIKRTDAVGDWYVYDTARGMTVLTDPYLFLNSTAAEVATLGSVTTVSTGFALNSAILADINVNAGSYIFFAVA